MPSVYEHRWRLFRFSRHWNGIEYVFLWREVPLRKLALLWLGTGVNKSKCRSGSRQLETQGDTVLQFKSKVCNSRELEGLELQPKFKGHLPYSSSDSGEIYLLSHWGLQCPVWDTMLERTVCFTDCPVHDNLRAVVFPVPCGLENITPSCHTQSITEEPTKPWLDFAIQLRSVHVNVFKPINQPNPHRNIQNCAWIWWALWPSQFEREN